jgi:hypothetical protein
VHRALSVLAVDIVLEKIVIVFALVQYLTC